AAVLALQVVRLRRIGNAPGVEAVAIVHHVNADEVAPELDAYGHAAGGIFARAIANRVAQGFGEGGAEVEADAAGGQRAGGDVSRNQLDRVADHPEIELVATHVPPGTRSEEHTSELQSRGHLVCRL